MTKLQHFDNRKKLSPHFFPVYLSWKKGDKNNRKKEGKKGKKEQRKKDFYYIGI